MTFERTVAPEDLERLKNERDAADRRYNEALSALDAALYPEPQFPHPPPAPDETQITPLNERWDVLGAAPASSGWRGRIAGLLWRVVAPAFERQQAFNSALVDHINRNAGPQREIAKSIGTSITVLSDQVARVRFFQARLMVYVQQMTAFIDTKDYEFSSLNRRIAEDAQADVARLEEIVTGLHAAVKGLSNETLKHFESFGARDQRYDGRIENLRTSLAVVQQQTMVLKREFERLPRVANGAPAAPSDAPAVHAGHVPPAPAPDGPAESWKYVGFEDLFRGSQDEIRQRLTSYLPVFAGSADVLDIGCGRGEFLDLLREAGVSGRGLDLNHEMVEVCRARGLDVSEGDALGYLRTLPDESLGGLIAAQVVEHLQPDYLLRFLDEAQRVLRPGSAIVLETINVACWLAFFESYVRDITHVRPLHPDTLQFLVKASGFSDVEVEFRAPIPEANRLQITPAVVREAMAQEKSDLVRVAVEHLADTLDTNVHRINSLIFTHLDYAVVGKRA